VPAHVAFIMDGNRRYARGRGLDAVAGHRDGFARLERVLHWCLELGVRAVTVYAFSLDNFRRPQAEVDALMALAREKFQTFQLEGKLIRKHRMRLQVLGDLTRVPEGVRREMDEAVKLTEGHEGPLLNVCFAYTSHWELLTAARALASEVRSGARAAAAVDAEAVDGAMVTARAPGGEEVPPPDLIVRTSGERRLSNFLLWQCSGASLVFLDALWPALSALSFLGLCLRLQVARRWSRPRPCGPP